MTIKTASKALGNSENECVILPLSSLKQPVKKLSGAGKRWSAEALKQYAAKVADLKKADAKSAKAKSVVVNFSAGGASAFLFVDPKISTFQLQTEVRKAFEG